MKAAGSSHFLIESVNLHMATHTPVSGSMPQPGKNWDVSTCDRAVGLCVVN